MADTDTGTPVPEKTDAMQAVLEQQKQLFEQLKNYRDEVSQKVDDAVERLAKLETIDERLAAVEKDIEEREKQVNRRPGTMGAEQKDFGPDGFSIGRLLFDPKSAERAYSVEYTDKVKQRAHSQSTDTEGGFLVAEQMLPGFIEEARARTVVWDPALITVHEGLTGSPVTLPTESGSTSVSWGGENVAATEASVTFSQLSFTPNRLTGFSIISRRLDLMAPQNEQIIRRNLGRTVGIEIDRVLLRGSGTNNEPEGVANTASINTVALATDGAIFTFDNAWDMVVELEQDNTLTGNLSFVMHPLVAHHMRQERIAQFSGQTTGAYVMLPQDDASVRNALGFNFLKTTQIPTNLAKGTSSNLSEVYFGNFEDLHLGIWQDLEFRVSEHATDGTTHAFLTDNRFILVNLTADVEIARATSFVLVNDAATTNPVS